MLTDPSSSSLTDEEADEQPPSVGSFINHSVSIALFTSQLFSQIKSGTLVMLVYDRETVLQVVHNRGHGFQKFLPCRGAQIATHTRSTSEKPNQNPTRPLLELCPRGNNKDVIIIILVHDKVYIPC